MKALAVATAALLVCTATSGQTITEIIDPVEVDEPAGIAVDTAGNVYVAGENSHNAVKIEPDGSITPILDDDPLFRFPRDIAVDAAGNVYVTGGGTDNAFKIDAAGTVSQIIDASGDGLGSTLDVPWGIAADAAGNVYVVGSDSDNVFKIDSGGAISQILDASGDGVNPLTVPYEITLDAAGNVYVTARHSDNVFKIDPAGAISQILDVGGDGVNPLSNPHGVAVDAAGNVYVAGAASNNAFKVEPDGTISQIIDESGDGLGNTLCYPIGIAVDAAGNVFVSGADTYNVFRIEPGGTITELMDVTGDGLGNPLELPEAVAVDACGNAYVVGASSDNAFRLDQPAPDADFRPGQRLVGFIAAADDVDEFSFYATAESRLTITASPRGKGNGLVPSFTIRSPGGAVLATSEAKGKSARVTKLEVAVTGPHCVSLTGAGGSTGDYRVKTKAKVPTKVMEIVEVGANGGSLMFEGIPGMTLKRLRVKALAPKGAFATVGGIAADLKPEVTFLAACGVPVTLGPLKTSTSGKVTVGKNVSELTHAGPHRLTIEGGTSVGFAKVVAKLNVEKGKGEVNEN